jgi:ATP-binding cassette subfamily F protein 3
MLGGANFLILDEPTNHLDLFSKEILEGALRDFPGTVFYISHDRYFINSTATKVLEMSAAGLTEYLGNYDYYLEKKLEAVPARAIVKAEVKNGWKSKKEAESAARKQEARKKRLEQSIQEMEEKIAACEAKLALDEIARDASAAAAIFAEKTAFEETLMELYDDYVEE